MKTVKNSITLSLVICVVAIGIVLASAAVAGAGEEKPFQAFPSYVNPITGKIEDTGQNPEIGQPMTEDLIKKTPATLLIDDAGSLFITFRMGLVKDTQDLRLELLDAQGAAKEGLAYKIVEEFSDKNERDLRVQIPEQTSVLRVSLVATPMGREVIGFVSFAPEGEQGAVTPLPEPIDDAGDDGSALSIYENAGNDEPTGVKDEDRGKVLLFLAVAGGILLVAGAVAGVVYLRKKKSLDSK